MPINNQLAAPQLTVPQRAVLYIYGTPNIAGSLLALGGLCLFFAGIIHLYWWAIVAGLYGAGALGWPRNHLAQTAQQTKLSTEMLAQQVRRLVDSVSQGLPNDALHTLRSIENSLKEMLPRLLELQDRGIISQKDSFTVLETVRRYLPDTLAAYLRLPKLYAEVQVLADGRTASQTLLEQLNVLDTSLKDIARIAYTGDGEMLIRNGRFLEARFAEKMAFRP